MTDIFELIKVLKPIVIKYGWNEVEKALYMDGLYDYYLEEKNAQ